MARACRSLQIKTTENPFGNANYTLNKIVLRERPFSRRRRVGFPDGKNHFGIHVWTNGHRLPNDSAVTAGAAARSISDLYPNNFGLGDPSGYFKNVRDPTPESAVFSYELRAAIHGKFVLTGHEPSLNFESCASSRRRDGY